MPSVSALGVFRFDRQFRLSSRQLVGSGAPELLFGRTTPYIADNIRSIHLAACGVIFFPCDTYGKWVALNEAHNATSERDPPIRDPVHIPLQSRWIPCPRSWPSCMILLDVR